MKDIILVNPNRPNWYRYLQSARTQFGRYDIKKKLFKASALLADAFYKSICQYVCPSNSLFTFWGTA